MLGAIPTTMCAAQFERFGGPDVLGVRTVPVPVPGPHEVLVRVEASGVNPKDAIIRGQAPRPWSRHAFPRGTGFDFSGEVAGVGAEVMDLRPGQPVWGFLDGVAGGAAAEYVAVPRGWLAPRPRALGASEAAALPLVGTAALQALRDVARIRPGDRLLIKGATGGVGSAAIQIGKILGAHVTAVAGRAGPEPCHAAGADVVVNEAALFAPSAHRTVDVFLDCAGSSPIRRYSRLFRRGGRWVTVAPNVPVFILTPLSSFVGWLGIPRFGYLVVRPRSADLERIADYVDDGALRPPRVVSFPLEQIGLAHEAIGRRGRGDRPVVSMQSQSQSSAPEPRSKAWEASA